MVKRITVTTTKAIFTSLFILALGAVAPLLYRSGLRGYLSSKAVRIEVFEKNKPIGGGTGFYVKGLSGKTYIMTNRHVCHVSKNQILKIVPKGGPNKDTLVDAKVIQISNKNDLCLIESPDNTDGLSLADDVYSGDQIHYAGYPRLQPLTMVSGEAVGYSIISVFSGLIGVNITEKECLSNKDMVVEKIFLPFFAVIPKDAQFSDLSPFTRKACIQIGRALVTTFVVYPGASGSPVTNSFGQVVGVIYAGPANGGWGWAVPLTEVREFLLKR